MFYLLATLPAGMQLIGYLLPPAYVFEGMRTVLAGSRVSVTMLAGGTGLALLYVLLACWLFTRVYHHAVHTGLIARYSAETLG